jgi:hypothetical protein
VAELGDISSVRELVSRIRQGLVPRAVRLFAAQGLLPVAREELIRVLALLAAEGDVEIALAARETLSSFTPAQCRDVLRLADLEPVEIDLLARVVADEAFSADVVKEPRTADETLRWLARTGSAATQDAIITNQRRVMGCLELLDDLRANASPDAAVLRRIKEFEEEFLEKACTWAMQETPMSDVAAGPSIEDELAKLRALGMQIATVGTDPVPELSPAEAVGQPAHDLAFLRIARMNTFQRIMCALKGTREERAILVRDRNLLVVRAVLSSPRLTEHEVEAIAGMPAANDEALRAIGRKPAWLRRYATLRNLLFNPKTPPGISVHLAPRLSDRDLGALTRDRNVPEALRKFAREVRSTRR